MSYNSTPSEQGGMLPPLSIGNVVSTAFRLYSSHLKSYLTQALFATLWLLVPIYGWAKSSAKSAMISRLAFAELMNQPESPNSADQATSAKKWSFLGIYIAIGMRLILVYFGTVILGVVGLGLLSGLLGNNPVALGLLAVIFILGMFFALSWVYSRLIIAEVPLAVADGSTSKQSLSRSWSLTQDSVFRIQGIVLVAFLITLPIIFVSNYIPQIFMIMVEPLSPLYWTIYTISLVTSLFGNLFVIPFWQAIKAVLYYDLRSRREGLDLRLRDR